MLMPSSSIFASKRTHTALDSAAAGSAGRDREVVRSYKLSDASSKGRGDSRADGGFESLLKPNQEDVELESEVFNAGRVFERNRVCISQEDFLKMVLDLKWNDKKGVVDEFKTHGSVDFFAGRMFEHFLTRKRAGLEVVAPEQFETLVQKFDIRDVFTAGRIFDRHAKKNSDHGLGALEMQTLCRETKLGEILVAKFHTDPNILDEKSSITKTNETASEFQRRNEDASESELREEELKRELEEEEEEEEQHDKGKRKPSKSMGRKKNWKEHERFGPIEDSFHQVELALKEIEEIDRLISTYQSELNEEKNLQHDLPDAFSDVKASMLGTYIESLKDRRKRALSNLSSQKRQLRLAEHERYLPKGQQNLSSPALYDPCFATRLHSRGIFPYASYELEHQ